MANKQSRILIVGGGTFGLSTAYHLALSGYKSVTILEKGATIPSPLSAGNDVNKIIRAEYVDFFYSDLALEAMHEWANNPVFAPHYHETGYLLGNSGAAPQKAKDTVARSLESIQSHPAWRGKISGFRTRQDIQAAAPAFDGPMKGWEGYFNRFAGYAHAANALTSIYKAVLELGVRVHVGEDVAGFQYDGDRCIGVSTASGKRFPSDVVVLTVGASLGRVLPSVGRQVVAKAFALAHVQLTPAEAEQLKGIPVTYARDLGFFFEPEPGTGLLKLCSSGAGYTNFVPGLDLSVAADPRDSEFITPADEGLMRQLLRETLPHLADRPLINRRICWCADTADSDFIIDAVPGKKGLFLATGDSGHGFKMLPTVGKWIQDVIEKGRQDLARWQWKQGQDATGDISWRTGQLRDLKDLQPAPRL